MAVHSEFAPELRVMADRVAEMAEIEKGASDAKYALHSAHQYLSKAASSLEKMSKN